MNPPKGFRAYPLQDDEGCRLTFDRKALELPTGTLTVRLSHFSKDKETGEPTIWKLEIIRCTGLMAVDKVKKTSNPFCEIFWKGPAEKYERGMLFNKWIKVGETKYKHSCVDPVFERSDRTEYELPPIWTDLEVDGRGPGGGFLAGGAWVSRNNVPNPVAIEKEKAKSARIMNKKAGGGAGAGAGAGGGGGSSEAVSHVEKMTHTANLAVAAEIQNRMEMYKLLAVGEERERKAMCNEENHTRSVEIESLLACVRPQLEEQTRLGRLYTAMLERMQQPSMLLKKLRFRSAMALDSGGMRAVCRDQSNLKQYYVNVTPILYPEDEAELSRCANALLGCQHPSLIRLVEFAAHQLRAFSVEGFPSVNDRLVFTVLENLDDGISFADFVRKRWTTFDNEDFKCLLRQILGGLKYLHENDIVHRNLHPKCAKVFEIQAKLATHSRDAAAIDRSAANPAWSPSFKKSAKDSPLTAKCRSSRDNKLIANVSASTTHTVRNNLVCKLEDFWFLSNPRKAQCAYSLGRNDWGATLTPPPEVVRGQVTSASDIYSFGMCVFEWASNGQASLQHKAYPSLKGINALRTQIPLKWGDWVHDLIRQCLQAVPESRPSAQELIDFLNDSNNS